jgi:hypothetical protein
MKRRGKPVALKNAPMEYAPANELGVVSLFANYENSEIVA